MFRTFHVFSVLTGTLLKSPQCEIQISIINVKHNALS